MRRYIVCLSVLIVSWVSPIDAKSTSVLGYWAIDTQTQQTFGWHSNRRFPLCSTAKLLAVAAVLHNSVKQPGLLSKRLYFTEQDVKQAGYAPITRQHLTTGMTVAELCKAAIEDSDNLAMNLLIRLLGGVNSVNLFAKSLGDEYFRLDRYEPDLNSAIPNDRRDTTIPFMMSQDIKQLVLGNALPNEQRYLLSHWLTEATPGKLRIKSGVPYSWVVAHKTGTGMYGTTNDVGVVYPPHCKPIVLSLYYTQNKRSALPNETILAATTKEILKKFSKHDACLRLH